jgi:hypothetical protein
MEVLAAILMPDHLHMMRHQPKIAMPEWQFGCFDRLLRSEESLQEKWLYVEENPVRAGLVKRFEDWPYRYVFNED